MVQKVIKEFDQLKNIDQKFYCSSCYDICVYKCGTSLRFWENNGWINKMNPYGWFQWYFRYCLRKRSKDDKRQISRWKGIVSRFKGQLVKMIKYVGGKFDDYSISPKINKFYCLGVMNQLKMIFLLTQQINV